MVPMPKSMLPTNSTNGKRFVDISTKNCPEIRAEEGAVLWIRDNQHGWYSITAGTEGWTWPTWPCEDSAAWQTQHASAAHGTASTGSACGSSACGSSGAQAAHAAPEDRGTARATITLSYDMQKDKLLFHV